MEDKSMPQANSRSSTILLQFEALPANCTSYPVTNNRFSPSLRVGQFVVVDKLRRFQEAGALLLVKTPDGFRSIEMAPFGASAVGTIIGTLKPSAGVLNRMPSPTLPSPMLVMA
jgi:hypothetical protein